MVPYLTLGYAFCAAVWLAIPTSNDPLQRRSLWHRTIMASIFGSVIGSVSLPVVRRERWLLLGFVIVLGACKGSAAPEWKTFHDANAGFTADFPGDVEVPQGVDKSDMGGPQIYRFECRPQNSPLTFEVTFIAQSNSDEQISASLDSVENRKFDPTSAYTSSETKRIQLGSIPGVEHVLVKDTTDRGKGFRRYRVYSLPRGDYSVAVDSVTTADASGADVERFFNSFKIDTSN